MLHRTVVKSGYLSEMFVSFQGEGVYVGRRHLFVRLAGCNIRCRYCDTPDSLVRTPSYTVYDREGRSEARPNPISAGDLRRLIENRLEADQPIDAIALTGGEPLTQSEFLAEVLKGGGFGVPVLLETNGVLPRRLQEVLSWVDIVSMDIKLPSNSGEGEFWEAHADFLELARSKDLYAKILVDAGTASAEVGRAAQMLAAVQPNVPAFLQPIVGPAGESTIGVQELTALYEVAWRSLGSVRVLPQTHKLLGIR